MAENKKPKRKSGGAARAPIVDGGVVVSPVHALDGLSTLFGRRKADLNARNRYALAQKLPYPLSDVERDTVIGGFQVSIAALAKGINAVQHYENVLSGVQIGQILAETGYCPDRLHEFNVAMEVLANVNEQSAACLDDGAQAVLRAAVTLHDDQLRAAPQAAIAAAAQELRLRLVDATAELQAETAAREGATHAVPA